MAEGKWGQGFATTTRFGRAFSKVRSSLETERLGDFVEPDFELAHGACLALDAVPRIFANRKEFDIFKGNVGPFRHYYIDTLEARASCAAHAHARRDAVTDPESLLERALHRAYPLRELLCANTRVVALHGLIDSDVPLRFQERHGYQDVAAELLALVDLWSGLLLRLGGKTLVTRLHLIEAECYADQLILALMASGRDFSEAQVAQVERERCAACVSFTEAYEGIRAALSYIFHDKDNGVAIAPAVSWRDQRWVRICELERVMDATPRSEWNPQWEQELDMLHQTRSK